MSFVEIRLFHIPAALRFQHSIGQANHVLVTADLHVSCVRPELVPAIFARRLNAQFNHDREAVGHQALNCFQYAIGAIEGSVRRLFIDVAADLIRADVAVFGIGLEVNGRF